MKLLVDHAEEADRLARFARQHPRSAISIEFDPGEDRSMTRQEYRESRFINRLAYGMAKDLRAKQRRRQQQEQQRDQYRHQNQQHQNQQQNKHEH